jgi:hypothetical protein
VKGKDKGNPNAKDSSGGDTTKIEENGWLKGKKEHDKITMGFSTHCTLPGSSILAEQAIVEIMGNEPSTEKIIYSSIRTYMGSTRDSRKSQMPQEQDKGTVMSPSTQAGPQYTRGNISFSLWNIL